MSNLPSRLRVEGCDLAYDDAGSGRPAVLFLHGAGADHALFDDQVRAVRAAGHRTVTWDMRGHGMSRPTAADITAERLLADAAALIEEQRLERPVLVGHSLGGNIAQELVRRGPQAYAGLVVIDATWNTGPLRWWERLLLRLASPSLRLIPASALPAMMARASAMTDAARTDLTRAFAHIPKADFLAIWRATTTFVTPRPDYRTPVPLLLVRGSADRTGNIAAAMPAWARHEHIDEVVIDGAGHVPTQDAPAEVTSALLAFLDELDSPH